MRIGIDLTWLKPKKSGGVESYAKNLVSAFLKLEDKNEYFLLLALDNSVYLRKYFGNDIRITYVDCQTNANTVAQHLLWQSTKEYSVLKQNDLNFCFFPVYEMPIYKSKTIKCVTVIQDIQAIHFPEYFKKYELIWFHMAWKKVLKNSEVVIATTDYTNNDIKQHFKSKNNIMTIGIPVIINPNDVEDFKKISNKYGINENRYYYTICSMHKHKNLITLLKMIKQLKDSNSNLPIRLVISGVGGPNKNNFIN